MCECCEEIEFWKEDINKDSEILSQIVIKRKRSSLTTQTFELNYCPECGQDLKQVEYEV